MLIALCDKSPSARFGGAEIELVRNSQVRFRSSKTAQVFERLTRYKHATPPE